MGYAPSSGRQRLVLHICKGGAVGRFVDHIYTKRAQQVITVTYAWDDGSGKVIEPLTNVFASANEVRVLADISIYGMIALNNVSMMLDRLGTPWQFLGITDQWLSMIPAGSRESWIDSQSMPLPEEMRAMAETRMDEIPVTNRIGARCRSILESGRTLELEAFLRPEYRVVLRDLLRTA